MNIIHVKCPSCSADLDIPYGRNYFNCSFCRATILVKDVVNITDSDKIKNMLDISYLAINAKNYNEGLDYANKVLELDADNYLAWWGKSVSCFGLSYGDLFKMHEALTYAVKSYELANEEDKKTFKEKIISEIITYELRFEHIPFLLELFLSFGSDDKRTLIKIINILIYTYKNSHNVNKDTFANSCLETLELIKKIDIDEYEIQKKFVDEAFDLIGDQKRKAAEKYKSSITGELFKKTMIWSSILILLFSAILSERSMFLFFLLILIFFGLYYMTIKLLASQKTNKYKRDL